MTPRPTLLVALGLAVCTLAGAAPGVGERSIASALEQAIAEAERALRQNEVQIADSRYRTALLEGWLLLGSLELDEGRTAEAREAFERAASAAVESRRARTSLALVMLRLEQAEEAAVLLRRVVAEHRTDFAARRLLAQALAATGQLDEAVQELEELRASAPENLENSYLLATAYLRQGRPDLAESLFAELVAARPIPQTRILIGRTYRDFGLYDRARDELEAALAADPEVRRAHYYLGLVDLLQGGTGLLESAMGHFEAELAAYPGDPMSSLYLGIALVELRRHREAVPLLEAASRSESAARDALLFLGRCHLALGRETEAAAALRRALELAEAELERLPEGTPADVGSRLSNIHYQLALALRRSGDETGAAVHFDAAKRYTAERAESSRESLRRYLESEARPRAFAPELSIFADLAPEERRELRRRVTTQLARAYLNLGVLQARAGRAARAATLFERAAELEPDFPQVQYSLGAALFNSGQFERATEPLARALEERPDDAERRRMLALARLNSERYDGAVELLRDDPERRRNPSLEYAYGVALVRSGRAAEAEPVFARLLAENADWPELNVVLGQAYAQQDEYGAAIDSLRRALELRPQVAEAHATLADIYLRQGRLDEAEAELRAELEIRPDDTRSRYTLATVLDLNREPDEALAVVRSLLRDEPRHADARYLLGKLLLAGDRPEEAAEQLEAAARLAPEDANIQYQLGQAYQRSGRAEAARQAFEAFRRLKDRERGGGPTR